MLMNHVARSASSRYPTHWAEEAIALAMENRWAAAMAANKRILDVAPDDVGALNRLGRASMELGQYEEAREFYAKTLALSPSNTIAQKNLARVEALQAEAIPRATVAAIEPRMFLAEPGKAVVASIKSSGKAAALVKVAVGEQVDLVVDGRALWVRDARGTVLGALEQRLARRIIELMEGGNRYDAALASASDDDARVIIRETYQDPSQLGKVSFPAMGATVRHDDLQDGLLSGDSDEEEEEVGDPAVEIEETTLSAEEEEASRRSLDEPFFAEPELGRSRS
ncbi:MAG: tetratricopeptide repeat protein [Chloroflexota bacterium]|nr:MAG: tetratricopeptide repeat protein [Chloroflexota bacterium]